MRVGCISQWKPTANIPYTPRQIATTAAADPKSWRREMAKRKRIPPKYATTGAIHLVAHTGKLVQLGGRAMPRKRAAPRGRLAPWRYGPARARPAHGLHRLRVHLEPGTIAAVGRTGSKIPRVAMLYHRSFAPGACMVLFRLFLWLHGGTLQNLRRRLRQRNGRDRC
jgi:hypothetical protein